MTRMIRICKHTGWDFVTYQQQPKLPTTINTPYLAGLEEGRRDRNPSH